LIRLSRSTFEASLLLAALLVSFQNLACQAALSQTIGNIGGLAEVSTDNPFPYDRVRFIGAAGHIRGLNDLSLGSSIIADTGSIGRISVVAGHSMNVYFHSFLTGSTVYFGSASDTGNINFNGWYGTGGINLNIVLDGGTLTALTIPPGGGVVVHSLNSVLSVAKSLTINNDATLYLSSDATTISRLEGNGQIGIVAPLTIGGGTFSTGITGASRLIFSGDSTWTGVGASIGTLEVRPGVTLTTSNSAAVESSANLQIDGTHRLSSSLAVDGLSGSGLIVLDPGVRLTAGSQNASSAFSGTISGDGGFTKEGAGVQTLTGTNTYTGGTTITTGMLALSGTGSLAAGGSLTLAAAGASFDISGASGGRTVGGLSGVSGSTVALGANTLTFGDATNQTFGGVISGTGGILKQGAGTQTLTASNIYTGGTTINAGTLALSGAGSLGAAGALNLAGAGAVFDISGATSNRTIGGLTGAAGSVVTLGANTLTFGDATNRVFAGSIGGTGGIVKQGTGRQTLSGPSSYSGTTTVAAGELRVDGVLTGPGTVTVSAGATLSGTGSIAAAVTVDGTLSAGHSPGTLTVGSLTLNSGSTSVFELNTPGVVGGSNPVTGNDLVAVTGDLTLGGALDARAAAAGYYRLFDYGGTLAGSFDSQSVTSTRGGFAVASAQVDTAVPGHVNLVVLGAGQTLQFWDGANTSATAPSTAAPAPGPASAATGPTMPAAPMPVGAARSPFSPALRAGR
jgi:fibronectin-binding autotransporter adhesin